MSGYGAFLIAALIVASGIIAYVGDVIGRRMGRRRLTLFGLRPRYTAITISVFAGMLIAAFTLISAMLVSQNVRDAFLRMEVIRKENAELERTAQGWERRAQTSRRRAALAQQNLDQVRRQLVIITTALQQQTARLEREKRDLTMARQRLQAASQQLGARTQELAARTSELVQQKQNLEAVRARLSEVSAELENDRRELALQRSELGKARATLAETQGKLESESKQLSEVEAKLDSVNRQLENASRAAFKAAGEVIALYNQSEQLQARIKDLEAWGQAREQTIGEIRTQPVIFGANEEILTVVIPGARPAAAVRADLDDFVKLVNQVALDAGSSAQGGRGIAIDRPVQDETTGQIVYYSEDQVLGALATAIANAQGSVIVRAASARNVVRGEPVPVDFELFHNQLLFHQGDELARASFDSSRDQASLLLDLVAFLRGRVASRARAAGVMARPATHLGQGKEALFPGPDAIVGEIPYPELLEIIRQIKSRKGNVQIVARAAADTWTAGPLAVKLSVEGRA
jgi:uncharacterized protein (DUF3084 family)